MEYRVNQVTKSLGCTSSCTYVYRIFGNDESGLVRAALQWLHGMASVTTRMRVRTELRSAIRIREFCYQNAVLLGGTTVVDDGARAQLMRMVDDEALGVLVPDPAPGDQLKGLDGARQLYKVLDNRCSIAPTVHEAARFVYDDLLNDAPLIALYSTLHCLSESTNIVRSSNEVSRCVESYASRVVAEYMDHMFVLGGVSDELAPITSSVELAENRAGALAETERVDRLIATVEASRPSHSK